MAQAPVAPRVQRVSVVTAGFGQNIVMTIVTTFMLVYLIEYAHISAAGMGVVTVIITVTKIFDAVTDPLAGSIVDLTRSRWGKLRPYILFSALPAAVLSAMLFAVPDASEPAKIVYFAVCYFAWGIAYTFCDVPFWGLVGSAFVDPRERTRVIGLVRAFGAISLGLATLGMPWLARALSFDAAPGMGGTTGLGWSRAVALACFVGMGLFLLAFFNTRERTVPATDVERPSFRALFGALWRNRPLLLVLLGSILGFGRFIVQAGGAVFVVIAYGDEGYFTLIGAAIILGLVLASFFTPQLFRWFSARTLIAGSSLVAVVLYVVMFVAGFENLFVVVTFIFLTGLTLGAFMVVQTTMIADAVDDVERRTGVRNDGISFSTLTFVSKIMNALAVLVFGAFVVIAGYDSGVIVTPAMQNTIYAAITLVPAASCLVSVVPFLFYRISDPAQRNPLAGSRAGA